MNETKLDKEIKSWLAFAAQKVVEVNALAKALAGQKDEVPCPHYFHLWCFLFFQNKEIFQKCFTRIAYRKIYKFLTDKCP